MFACIYIPDFPVEAIVRAEPLLRTRAVAALDGKPPVVRVVSLNEKARQLGMEVGLTKLQAAMFAGQDEKIPGTSSPPIRERKPSTHSLGQSHNAVLRQRSPEQERSSHAAILDIAHAFTPRVEDTAFDTVLLDLAGMERLYGEPANMARDLALRIGATSMQANLALAANPEAAMLAARGFRGVTVIPADLEAQRLAGLPIQVLLDAFDLLEETVGRTVHRERDQFHEQLVDTLQRWGMRDFRALARLPEHALAARLGGAGARLQRLARGEGHRTLALATVPMHFEEAFEPESSVETIESVSFILNRLLEQLCMRLEARSLAVQSLTLRLQLEHRVADEATTTLWELRGGALSVESHNVVPDICTRTLQLPVAMRDAKVFLKLLQLELDAHPPGAPVIKLWIAAEPAPPRVAQRGLFLPITPEAEKMEVTLARINRIVGERRAGIALLLDTHREHGFRMERFTTVLEEPGPAASTPTMWDSQKNPAIALRIFRPPRKLLVQATDGCPLMLTFLEDPTDHTTSRGKILWSAGPWRSSGDWWTEQAADATAQPNEAHPWDREEWDVALADGYDRGVALYRIYREVQSGRWFADASYD